MESALDDPEHGQRNLSGFPVNSAANLNERHYITFLWTMIC